jgi:hypothetical protein
MSAVYTYRACFMSDLAKRAGVDVSTFKDWFTQDDKEELEKLGWQAKKRLLPPPVVKYITEKFLPDYER